ncbi:hypothetical protein F8S13_21485 [Chloroflexia bacterium SDU3-3]|nr:hypothetical protein F8S13_21485 [Chloroflexia bacterium SDU3-3]
MLQRETPNTPQVYLCPTCACKLHAEGELLVCAKHGAFFAYGPHLLVRAPSKAPRVQEASMPWEINAAQPR